MKRAIKVIQFMEAIQKQGINKEAAKQIAALIDSREDNLATKQDLERLSHVTKQDLERVSHATKQEIEQSEQRTRQEIERLSHATRREIGQLKQATEHLGKGQSRIWHVMLVGIGLLLAVMFHLHNNNQDDMRALKAELKAEMNAMRREMREMREGQARIEKLIITLQGKETAGKAAKRTKPP